MRRSPFFALLCAAGSASAFEAEVGPANRQVWQAGEPMVVNVAYDVPAFGQRKQLAALEEGARFEPQFARASEQGARQGSSFTQGSFMQRASSPEAAAKALPIVEVSLASPPKPLPEVSAVVGDLDHAREAAEAGGMDQAHRGFNKALRKASSRFGGLAERAARIFEVSLTAQGRRAEAKALSFASAGGNSRAAVPQPTVVAVEVTQASPPDASVVKPLLEALESGMAAEERSLFDSAVTGFDGLTDLVLAETLAQVQSLADGVATELRDGRSFNQASFLAGGAPPEQSNVRVVASDVPYPTVASLAEDMEARRSTSSGLVRARLLELDLSLLKRENQMIRTALEDVSKQLVAHTFTEVRSP